MPFWSRRRSARHSADVREAVQKLTDRVTALEEAVMSMQDIREDWDSVYEKYRTLYARLNKRVEREEKKQPEQQPINPAAARLLGLPSSYYQPPGTEENGG